MNNQPTLKTDIRTIRKFIENTLKEKEKTLGKRTHNVLYQNFTNLLAGKNNKKSLIKFIDKLSILNGDVKTITQVKEIKKKERQVSSWYDNNLLVFN